MNGPSRGAMFAFAPLLGVVVTGIITLSIMYDDIGDNARSLRDHEEIAAHSNVEARLSALEAKLEGLERSVETVHRSNDRIYDRLWMLENPHRYGDEP